MAKVSKEGDELRAAVKLLSGRGRKGGGCPHPPQRLWSWFARDDTHRRGEVLCVGCCDCGAVLLGGVELPSQAGPTT